MPSLILIVLAWTWIANTRQRQIQLSHTCELDLSECTSRPYVSEFVGTKYGPLLPQDGYRYSERFGLSYVNTAPLLIAVYLTNS